MFGLGGCKVTFPETATELNPNFTHISPVMSFVDARILGAEKGNCLMCLFFAKHSGSVQPQTAPVAATCHCLWLGKREDCEGIQAGRKDLLTRLLLSVAASPQTLSVSPASG